MIQRLHERAILVAQTLRRAESELIEILQQLDRCHGYRELGFKSLFDCANQGLRLSEGVSYNLITIARKALEVPMLQEKIRDQEISVSNARMITPVLTLENQQEWLQAAADLSKRELEKKIAQECPERKVREGMRFVADDCVEVKLLPDREVG